MYRTLKVSWSDSSILILTIRELIDQDIVGVCITSRGYIHKISTLSAKAELRKWAEQIALETSMKVWGKTIFPSLRPRLVRQGLDDELSRIAHHGQDKPENSAPLEEKLPKKFGVLEIRVKNQKNQYEYILILVFLKKRHRGEKLFQTFLEKYNYILEIQDSLLGKILFSSFTQF